LVVLDHHCDGPPLATGISVVIEQVLALLPRLPSGQLEADRALLQGLEPKLAVLQPLLAGASMTMAEVGG
jgi:hypothetical protein